eukprot:scaffold1474_cov256-Pinguiococcus_pyrenoidosus.AAC.17
MCPASYGRITGHLQLAAKTATYSAGEDPRRLLGPVQIASRRAPRHRRRATRGSPLQPTVRTSSDSGSVREAHGTQAILVACRVRFLNVPLPMNLLRFALALVLVLAASAKQHQPTTCTANCKKTQMQCSENCISSNRCDPFLQCHDTYRMCLNMC